MKVGPGLDAEFERINAQLRLLFLANAIGLAQIASS